MEKCILCERPLKCGMTESCNTSIQAAARISFSLINMHEHQKVLKDTAQLSEMFHFSICVSTAER